MRRTTTLCALILTAASAPLQAQAVPLATGQTVRATLATGDTARYVVTAEANSIIRAVVTQRTVNVLVRVLSPSGRLLALVDGPSRGDERIDVEATVAGAYQLQVIPFEKEVGDYAITLRQRERLATEPKQLTDQLLARYDRTDGPGVIVSVWQGGKTLYTRAFGMANLTYDIPLRVDSRTNIGSTSKQFTAFAVMLLVEQGKVQLDEDVRTYIPELPDLGKRVSVRHLLTHTSGYREFLNTISLTGRRLDHGDFIDRSELISVVQRQPALQNDPGAEFNYNNTAFGLLAVIVERASGRPFPAFMAANVFQPLGMTRSLVRASPEAIVPGGSEGYAPGENGTWRAIGDLGGAMGAGGIYTTVGDLQKWAQNLAHPTVGSAASIAQMKTPYTLTDGTSTGYGFGLFIDKQGALTRVQHGGADVAHRSQLVSYPEIDAGLTIQSNDATFDSGLAFRIGKAFFGASMEPTVAVAEKGAADAFDPSGFKAASFDAFVGRYALDAAPAFILTFSRAGDSLFTQATGQGRIPIYPTSDSTFALRVVQASVSFHRDASGAVVGATLHQNGDQHATRLSGEAAAAWKPSPADLRQYAGRYYSDELETFYDLVVVDSSLVLQQRRLDPSTLSSGAVDTFAANGVTVSFERDRNRQVIGFYVSNIRTRGVRFERVR